MFNLTHRHFVYITIISYKNRLKVLHFDISFIFFNSL